MDKELLDLYFKKFHEFQEGDDAKKGELIHDLKSLQKCINEMWGISSG